MKLRKLKKYVQMQQGGAIDYLKWYRELFTPVPSQSELKGNYANDLENRSIPEPTLMPYIIF
jgi:hypothetical protein